MTNNQISTQNWQHTSFKCGDLEAFISVGATPKGDEVQLEYFLNKSKNSDVIFQENFTVLEEAIKHINTTYNHWNFLDKEAELANSGCSTCQAH